MVSLFVGDQPPDCQTATQRILEVPPDQSWKSQRWFDGFASAFIASVFSAQGFSACRLPRLGMDHKLLQSRALKPYWGHRIPRTDGLSQYLSQWGPSGLKQALAQSFPDGYVIKPTVGAGTGDRGNFDCSSKLERVARRLGTNLRQPADEKWIVQERLAIHLEMRIHTFERTVLASLSFPRWGDEKAKNDEHYQLLDSFEVLIDQLPELFITGTAWGWDVARLEDGRLAVIEGNPTGTFFRAMEGFNCSGYFSSSKNGPQRLIKLWRFLQEKYGFQSIHVLKPFPSEFRHHIEAMSALLPTEFYFREAH